MSHMANFCCNARNCPLAKWSGGIKQLNPQSSSPGSRVRISYCMAVMTSWLEAVWLCGDAISSRALTEVKYFMGTRMAMIAIMASTTTANRLQKRSGRWAVAVTPDGLSIRTVGAVLPEIVSTAVFTWLIHSNLCEVLDLRSSLDSALIGMA